MLLVPRFGGFSPPLLCWRQLHIENYQRGPAARPSSSREPIIPNINHEDAVVRRQATHF